MGVSWVEEELVLHEFRSVRFVLQGEPPVIGGHEALRCSTVIGRRRSARPVSASEQGDSVVRIALDRRNGYTCPLPSSFIVSSAAPSSIPLSSPPPPAPAFSQGFLLTLSRLSLGSPSASLSGISLIPGMGAPVAIKAASWANVGG